ncbi:hypothetical protein I4U23_012585 [Adineta vaga]|nr:hypothetical protein I4U23_012585 [Adineta vaga]
MVRRSLFTSITIILIVIVLTNSLSPIIFIPGSFCSLLEVRINTTLQTSCPKSLHNQWILLWLNLQFFEPNLLSCYHNILKFVYNSSLNSFENPSGVETRIVPNSINGSFLDGLLWEYVQLDKFLFHFSKNYNYTDGQNLRSIPYDFRRGTNESLRLFNTNLKELIELTYNQNLNKSVHLISHSTGGSMTLYFLTQQSQIWKDQFINSWISLSGNIAGEVDNIENVIRGFLSPIISRDVIQSWDFFAWRLPEPMIYGSQRIIVQTPSRNYTSYDIHDLLYNANAKELAEIYSQTSSILGSLPAPNVNTYCFFGTNLSTPIGYRLKSDRFEDGKLETIHGWGDGEQDDTTNMSCQLWNQTMDRKIKSIVVPKQAKSNLKVPIHPSLYSFGRIIIYHEGLFAQGGPGALNYLHCALVTAGFNSFIQDFNVSSNDIVVIPESAYFEKVPFWKSSGGRIVIYMLGMNAPLANQYHTNVIWAPSSTYSRDLYLATGKQVLFSPIETIMYDIYQRDLKDMTTLGKKTKVYRDVKQKENLILIDNDSYFPSSLQTLLENFSIKPKITFKLLRSIDFREIPSWFKRAKLVIDLGVAGVERVNNEGALFDAIVLIANSLNGMDPTDFPIPEQFKLDTRNESRMFEVITFLLPQWQTLKELTLNLPHRFLHEDIPSFFSTRSFKFMLITSTFEEESAIIPFALHCAVHFPLARIEAKVENLQHFNRNHDMILKLLKELTNLSLDWLFITEKTTTIQRGFANESQYIIFIDPRNMIIDEQLPHILVHLLEDKTSLTLTSSCFGSVAHVIGDVTIWRADMYNDTIISPFVMKHIKKYETLLEEQLVNIYAKRMKNEYEKGIRLASALYATQRHKLLQSMLPLAVPRFTTIMNEFEALYPKDLIDN